MILTGETEELENKNYPNATLSVTKPTWSNPGLCYERPATNRLDHGTALRSISVLSSHLRLGFSNGSLTFWSRNRKVPDFISTLAATNYACQCDGNQLTEDGSKARS
jgi:hypothetical protein